MNDEKIPCPPSGIRPDGDPWIAFPPAGCARESGLIEAWSATAHEEGPSGHVEMLPDFFGSPDGVGAAYLVEFNLGEQVKAIIMAFGPMKNVPSAMVRTGRLHVLSRAPDDPAADLASVELSLDVGPGHEKRAKLGAASGKEEGGLEDSMWIGSRVAPGTGWLHVGLNPDGTAAQVVVNDDGTVLDGVPWDARPVIKLEREGIEGLRVLLELALSYIDGDI